MSNEVMYSMFIAVTVFSACVTLSMISRGGGIESGHASLHRRRFEPQQQFHSNLQQVPGTLSHISCRGDGNTVISGVREHAAYIWNGEDWERLQSNIPTYSSVVQVDMVDNGEGWALDATGGIYKHERGKWSQLPGAMKQMSAASGHIAVAVSKDGSVWKWNHHRREWHALAGRNTGSIRMQHVSVGSDEDLWATSEGDKIWHWNNQQQQWEEQPGRLKIVSCARRDMVVGVASDHTIWQWNSSTRKWNRIEGSLDTVSVSSNGQIWGLKDSNVFRLVNHY